MPKEKTYRLTGVAEYAKIFPANRDMTGYKNAYTKHNGAYTIDVYLDATSAAKLKASGSMKKGVATDRGLKVKFTRKHEIRRNKDNAVIEAFSGPPKVVDQNGAVWNPEVTIGNGSKVAVWIAVADIGDGMAVTRLEAVEVLDHVEFRRDSADDHEGEVELPTDNLEDKIPF